MMNDKPLTGTLLFVGVSNKFIIYGTSKNFGSLLSSFGQGDLTNT